MIGSVRRNRLRGAALVVLALAVAACGGPGSGAILANSPVARPTPPPTPTPSPVLHDPQPISLPADDAAHHRLTEWWYYTGHLATDDGHRYGFEFVVFRAERGPLPVTWASHIALTDESGGAFHYAQRSEIGAQVNRRQAGATGEEFDLAVTSNGLIATEQLPAWHMAGANGRDSLEATLSPAEAKAAGLTSLSFQFATAPNKPAVLHNGNGWIDFGPAGGSYYYSRTSLALTGQLEVNGRPAPVHGQAWFDHQWGDFIAVGGGWDWFAVNLADGTDFTLSLVRSGAGQLAASYGTLVRADGSGQPLVASDFSVATTSTWTSPTTGATYPAGWTVTIPGQGLVVHLRPTVADQELDTRATTGVVYWEGSQVVSAERNGKAVGGEAYIELTGYPAKR